MQLFLEINAEGATMVMATHDKAIVDKMQKRVLALENGCLTYDSVGGWTL
jgi:cell division transport system ATP-binding protein